MNLPPFLSRLKARLEALERGAATLTVTLRDFLIVTYAVPAERARPHVPESLPLDVLPGADGETLAFIQTTCFFNDNFHWSPLPGPGLSFYQSTYRILTRQKGRRGAFFLRTYLSTIESHLLQRAIAREVDHAPFTVQITGNPIESRYERYTMRAVGERGQTAMDVQGREAPLPTALPFTDWDDMVFFLTQREEAYYDTSAGGMGLLPVEHARMHPVPAELMAARLSLWTDLGLIDVNDLLRPVAVLIQPTIVFTSYPPRPVRGDA